MKSPSQNELSRVGLKVTCNILEKWDATDTQICTVLNIEHHVLHNHRLKGEVKNLNETQLKRISFILNIHEVLSLAFENKQNLHGFMNRINHNDFFCGRKPIDIISSGSLEDLEQVYFRLRGTLYIY